MDSAQKSGTKRNMLSQSDCEEKSLHGKFEYAWGTGLTILWKSSKIQPHDF